MPQYILRDLPTEMWDKVKQRAQRDGWPLRALMLQLLDDYGAFRISPTTRPPGGTGRFKFNVGDRVIGRDSAPAWVRERQGTVQQIGPGPSEYVVRFDDGPTEPVQSSWVDKFTEAS